jgi:Flp pilus assembly protein TadG
MSLWSSLTQRARSAWSDETGSISIEAVIILPVLVLFFLVSFTFYDAYRTQTVITKAGYTVADLLSRNPNTVDTDDVDGLSEIFQFITRSRNESFIRVSRVTRFVDVAAGIDEYRVDASYATNGYDAMSALELTGNLARIPVLAANTSVTVVETYSPYVPPFFIGLEAYTMESWTVTPQRSGNPIATNFPGQAFSAGT